MMNFLSVSILSSFHTKFALRFLIVPCTQCTCRCEDKNSQGRQWDCEGREGREHTFFVTLACLPFADFYTEK
jgi:hypothetical protein